MVQALAEAGATQAIDDVLDTAHVLAPIDRERARHAAALLQRTGTTDVPDALVAVEALRNAPSIVVTSDRTDLRRLLDADDAGRRVVVRAV